MDRRGHLVHFSERGRKLLFLASYPKISPLTVNPKHQDFATATRLAQLCNNLIAVFEGRSGALPPVWHHQNSWGRFCFRAYWLDEANRSGHSAIGITVTHQIPLPVKLAQIQEQLSLSQRQLDLCLLLVSGQSYSKIGKQLGQSEISVVAQSKRLYHSLRTRTREEFIAKLRSL
jgi:DNA-binding CsgD family transcriptional regulator